MKLLKTIMAFVSIAASITSAADDVSIQLVQSDGRKKRDYKAEVGGIVVLRVAVQNLTASQITVGYIGAGSGAFLAKVQDRDIDPASEAMFTVIVDNDSLGVPSNVELAVGYTIDKQLRTARVIVTLASASVVSFSPGFLRWKVGDALEEKSATLSIPPQTKVIKTPEVDGFVIRTEGDRIFVKPVRTDKSVSAAVRLNTAPNMGENRVVPLFLSIAP